MDLIPHRPLRHRVKTAGLLLGLLVLGLSCSGPAPDRGGDDALEEGPARVFHVQLDMSKDKDAADHHLAEAIEWWEEAPASLPEPLELPGRTASSPVTVVWKAPLYRVRLGPFASRSAAEAVLTAAQRSFPDAFVVPEQRRARAQ